MIVLLAGHPTSNSTIRPNCPQCQTPMRLFGIESEDPGHELHSSSAPTANALKRQCDLFSINRGKAIPSYCWVIVKGRTQSPPRDQLTTGTRWRPL